MQELNFPPYRFRLKEEGQKKLIFDVVRKKFIPLTPEEWVRQHCIQHLVLAHHVRPENISAERELKFNGLRKRFDLLVFGPGAKPRCIVECKAPHVPISMETALQAGVYNSVLQCPWLWLTNGLQHVWLFNREGTLEPAQPPVNW